MRQLYLRLLSKKSIAIILVVCAIACSDETEKPATRAYPVVNTYEATDINADGVTLNGEILNVGNGVADHGFLYANVSIVSDEQKDIERISLGEKADIGTFSSLANKSMDKDQTYFYRAYAVGTNGTVVLGQELSFVSKGSSAPTIKDFSPKLASVSDTITITGSGFSNIIRNNTVRFGNVQSSWLDVKGNTMRAIVPGGTSLDDVNITVEVGQQKVVSTDKFRILPITIDFYEPTDVSFGDVITIHGTNLPINLTESFVTVLGKKATFVSSNRSAMQVRIALDIAQTTSPLLMEFGLQNKMLAAQIKLLPTEIASFNPGQARGGSVISITGTNFHPTPQENTVWFGNEATGVKAEVLTATNTELTVRTPNLAEIALHITVKSSFQTTTSAGLFYCMSEWKKISDFPGTARDDASAFSVGSYGYVGLGRESEGFNKKFWKYNPANDSWTEVASFNIGTGSGSFRRIGSFSGTNAGFVGVGNLASNDAKIVVKYDPSQDKWTSVTPYPVAVKDVVSFSINGKGYVGLGVSVSNPNDYSRKLYEYDPALNTWTEKKDFPGVNRSNANSFSIGSKGYVFSGGGISDMWEFDPATNQWTARTGPPAARFYSSTFAVNGKAYVVAGSVDGKSSAEVLEYDPAFDQWRKLREFPAGVREAGVAFVIGNKAYFGTGRAGGVFYKDFYEFDPAKL